VNDVYALGVDMKTEVAIFLHHSMDRGFYQRIKIDPTAMNDRMKPGHPFGAVLFLHPHINPPELGWKPELDDPDRDYGKIFNITAMAVSEKQVSVAEPGGPVVNCTR
jgi:hypothetical protein